MRYSNPESTTGELVKEWVSTLEWGQSATAWDVARAMGIPERALSAEGELERLVEKGDLVKEGNHYAKPEKRMSETEALMQNYRDYQRNLPPWARGPG
jgi:hypothetical protein